MNIASPENTMVLMTSALFVDAQGQPQTQAVAFRRERIVQSLLEMQGYGFRQFVLLDNTLPSSFSVEEIWGLPGSQDAASGGFAGINLQLVGGRAGGKRPGRFQPEADEFQQYGPSRLEAALLYQASPALQDILQEARYVLKVSAGYRIANFQAVFARARQGGAVYRMGNPLRQKIPFCLTSFYLLPVPRFLELVDFFYAHIGEMKAWRPLEYYMYAFVQAKDRRRFATPYPQLRAQFLAAGKSGDDPLYRLKEQVFNGLSRLGLYAYRLL